MGLIYLDIELLLSARRSGAKFTRIATIGRQSLYLRQDEVNAFLPETIRDRYKWGDYCEPYIKSIFGAEEITSIDASDYEGATIVHDMNKPLNIDIGRFDLVIDGGSLEHVFNFPTAISNLMKMVRVGGYLMLCNPANNLCGHGFYQFSPELMFRLLNPKNGFKMEELLLSEHRFASVEMAPATRVVRVRDPEHVGDRALITSGRPLMQRALALKLSEKAEIETCPQQSDYVIKWEQEKQVKVDAASTKAAFKKICLRYIPKGVQRHINEYRAHFNLSNRRFFSDWKPNA